MAFLSSNKGEGLFFGDQVFDSEIFYFQLLSIVKILFL